MDLSRRNPLFGRKPQAPTALQPPWATSRFTEDCTRCGECIVACPTGLLRKGDGGFPQPDFRQAECDFCEQCVTACQSGALQLQGQAWAYRAGISAQCLAHRQVECRVCGEGCPQQAIRFRLQLGKMAQPQLDGDLCNGCGACVSLCPAQAITVK